MRGFSMIFSVAFNSGFNNNRKSKKNEQNLKKNKTRIKYFGTSNKLVCRLYKNILNKKLMKNARTR